MVRRLASDIVSHVEQHELVYYRKIINDDCNSAAILLRRCLWYVFPSGYLVIQFFVFDIMGGAYPGNVAFGAILPGIFFFWGLVAFILLEYFEIDFIGILGKLYFQCLKLPSIPQSWKSGKSITLSSSNDNATDTNHTTSGSGTITRKARKEGGIEF